MSAYTSRIRPAVQSEFDAASAAEARGHFFSAFQHLERAHVLGQASTLLHVRVHLEMFRFAVRNRRAGEAFGQSWRSVAAGLFTALRLVPEGNTGGSDVSGFRRMPVAEDLRTLMDAARSGSPSRSERTMTRIFSAATVSLVLGALLGGCTTQPRDLDLSLDKATAAGVYQVKLVPPDPAPAIHQMHSWRVRLQDRTGAPVPGARFVVDGGMPQHGHGLPTQPRVTREIVTGTYQLDGMKFSMTGWWELKLAIQGPQGSDQVTFNTVVANPPAGE